jgi:hypothetical protein
VNDIANIISQLEHQKAAIERAISALREIEGPSQIGASTASGKTSQKRHISPEGRKRIAEALRRRWAAKRAAKASGTAATSKKVGPKAKGSKKTAA